MLPDGCDSPCCVYCSSKCRFKCLKSLQVGVNFGAPTSVLVLPHSPLHWLWRCGGWLLVDSPLAMWAILCTFLTHTACLHFCGTFCQFHSPLVSYTANSKQLVSSLCVLLFIPVVCNITFIPMKYFQLSLGSWVWQTVLEWEPCQLSRISFHLRQWGLFLSKPAGLLIVSVLNSVGFSSR